LEALLTSVETDINNENFAVYPNPFHGYNCSPFVSAQTELYLVDGSLSNQNNPIWPLIQPARANDISVLIVNDNSTDTTDNFPNEMEIYTTYVQAQQVGLSPPVSIFVSEGLNKRATFFGCNDKSALAIFTESQLHLSQQSAYVETSVRSILRGCHDCERQSYRYRERP
jgi:lysophospholipase